MNNIVIVIYTQSTKYIIVIISNTNFKIGDTLYIKLLKQKADMAIKLLRLNFKTPHNLRHWHHII